MHIEQIYTQCLAQGAYYIESEGEAAVIDPLRAYKPYIELAKKRGTTIKYVFETHFHADFVSGHIDLAKETRATIVYGPTLLKPGFDALIAADNQEFTIGKCKIRLIHTPGHTMESSCFLLMDENGTGKAIFTGDTLFIGDVGRPDLAQHVIPELTEEKLAAHLYDSLRNRIMPLNDSLIVYPGHGAGSACGKNLSKETSDTLGHQKQTNAALRPGLGKAQFVQEVLSGLMPPPGYFPENVRMNIFGYEPIDEVMEHGNRPLPVSDFEKKMATGKAFLLDTRSAADFGAGFIPGFINIGLEGNFAPWVGTLLPDIKQEILFVADTGKEADVVMRLARVGYNHPIGFLNGGVEAWKNAGKPLDTIASISVEQLADLQILQPETEIFDVRKKSEFDSEHLPGATNAPLDYIQESEKLIPKNKPVYVHCAAGYRSMIFVSMLRSKGYRNLVNITEGFAGIKASGRFELTEFVCPTTMLCSVTIASALAGTGVPGKNA